MECVHKGRPTWYNHFFTLGFQLALKGLYNIRLSGYINIMKNEARFFKSLADETRLKILWLLLAKEELCVCDLTAVLGITQSKASRHLRYLFNQGLVHDRREGVWMYYRLAVAPGSLQEKQLQLLAEMLASCPEAQFLRDKLADRLRSKSQPEGKEECQCA